MAGGHIATTPYHTNTLKGVGPVVGFWVGFSLGTCCRIWLQPPIHFILIPDPLHTYRKCLKTFNHGWWSYCHNTIPYQHSKRGWASLSWLCRRHVADMSATRVNVGQFAQNCVSAATRHVKKDAPTCRIFVSFWRHLHKITTSSCLRDRRTKRPARLVSARQTLYICIRWKFNPVWSGSCAQPCHTCVICTQCLPKISKFYRPPLLLWCKDTFICPSTAWEGA